MKTAGNARFRPPSQRPPGWPLLRSYLVALCSSVDVLSRLNIKHTRMVDFYFEVYFDCSQATGPSLVGSRKLTFLGLNESIDPILLSALTNYFLTAFGIMGKHTGATRQLCGVGSLLLPLRVLEIDMQQCFHLMSHLTSP